MHDMSYEKAIIGVRAARPAPNPGRPGPTYDPKTRATTFTVFAPKAWKVYIAVLNPNGREELWSLTPEFRQRDLSSATTKGLWTGEIPDTPPGTKYNIRVDGPWAPYMGEVFNPHKALIDPHASEIAYPNPKKMQIGRAATYDGHDMDRSGNFRTADIRPNNYDSFGYVPFSVVPDNSLQWDTGNRPKIPLSQRIICEVHVGHITRIHPDVPEGQRRTFSGLVHLIPFFQAAGVTTIELMPVHASHPDDVWGYNSMSFMALDPGYGTQGYPGGIRKEFADMVEAFHRQGLEIIVDVVYNHTFEGNHQGLTASGKGLDPHGWYRPIGPHYWDCTGCGASLNDTPLTRQIIMDSLRNLADLGVDGFRFDLLAALTRGGETHEQGTSQLLHDIAHDPELSRLFLSGEPWDCLGTQIGSLPGKYAEWDPGLRDSIGWLTNSKSLDLFIKGFAGSSDSHGWKVGGVISYIGSHDGPTLADRVRDITNTNDVSVNRQISLGLLTILMTSKGMPLVTANDICGQTQDGLHNPYDIDDARVWHQWPVPDPDLLHFFGALADLRKTHPALRDPGHFTGLPHFEGGPPDVVWLKADGSTVNTAQDAHISCFGAFMACTEQPTTPRATRDGDGLLVIFNRSSKQTAFQLPAGQWKSYALECTTTADKTLITPTGIVPGGTVIIPGHSVVILQASLIPRPEWGSVHGQRKYLMQGHQFSVVKKPGHSTRSGATVPYRASQMIRLPRLPRESFMLQAGKSISSNR